MSLLDTLISVIAPYDCLGCSVEGRILCRTCTALLPDLPERCYRCRKLSPGSRTCTSCRKMSRLYAVHVATEYEGMAQQIIWRLKFTGVRTAARSMSDNMLPLIDAAEQDVCIVPVPTATTRVRQRGYDQATLIARELAKRSDLPNRQLLRRHGKTHQVGARRSQRLKQLHGSFRVPNPGGVIIKHALLVDDVLTTGATLEAAAAALRAAGVQRVSALVYAQA